MYKLQYYLANMNLEVILSPKSVYTLRLIAKNPESTKSALIGNGPEMDRTMMKRLEELTEAGLVNKHPGGFVKGREVNRYCVTKRGELILAHLMLMESI